MGKDYYGTLKVEKTATDDELKKGKGRGGNSMMSNKVDTSCNVSVMKHQRWCDVLRSIPQVGYEMAPG